jgi:hypothetical protein
VTNMYFVFDIKCVIDGQNPCKITPFYFRITILDLGFC